MKQRMITGLLGGAAFLSLLWLGDLWYTALIFLIAGISYYEYVRMKGLKWYRPSSIIGYLLLFYLLTFELFDLDIEISTIPILWFVAFIFLSFTVLSNNRTTITDVAYLFLGAIYVGLGFHFMLGVRLLESGLEWTLLVIACVWATDSGAYFSGRLFGRRKLWPSISPKKTIEGALGGTLLSIIVAVLFYLYGQILDSLTSTIIIGFFIAVVGQLGDLIESALKRHLNVKDSGHILPGHGGLLDRFDSMLTVFPIMYVFIVILA